MTGAELIAAERRRQIEEEGYTAEHDAPLGWDELALAGIAYAVVPLYREAEASDWWPWDDEAFKPTGDVVRDLTKAGALIAAAIDFELASRAKRRLADA